MQLISIRLSMATLLSYNHTLRSHCFRVKYRLVRVGHVLDFAHILVRGDLYASQSHRLAKCHATMMTLSPYRWHSHFFFRRRVTFE